MYKWYTHIGYDINIKLDINQQAGWEETDRNKWQIYRAVEQVVFQGHIEEKRTSR